MPDSLENPVIAVIGAGPAGLMAADVLSAAGHAVAVFDAMPTAGRKLLRAGIGGLNLTHAESFERFVTHYGQRTADITPLLNDFGPHQLIEWVHGLGINTFVGSSQRVFPASKKAAPLLRAWLQRLRQRGVQFHHRHRWTGWNAGELQFQTPSGLISMTPRATVLALGGASWPQLGSDGHWVALLEQQGVTVAPLLPSNCGFQVEWSPHFRERYARQPIKSVRASLDGEHWHSGELMVTEHGLEGGLLYALSAPVRDQVMVQGSITVWLDLNPGRDQAQLAARLTQPQGNRSLAKHLKDKAGIDGVKAGLLREYCDAATLHQPALLAARIKALPVTLGQPFPLAKAISTAGGIPFEVLTPGLMLRDLPGVFCAGEMLDWEAPTGGYLLTACFASGQAAAKGVQAWLSNPLSAHVPV